MRYLPIYENQEEFFAELDDAQRGRLLSAMMAYCFRGEEPQLTGVERIVWLLLRQRIDEAIESRLKKQKAGRARHAKKPAAADEQP